LNDDEACLEVVKQADKVVSVNFPCFTSPPGRPCHYVPERQACLDSCLVRHADCESLGARAHEAERAADRIPSWRYLRDPSPS